MITHDSSNNDDRSNIPGRGSIRQNEIQLIKQLPIHDLLEKRGFNAVSRKITSANFEYISGIVDGKVFVFYASINKVWLCKYNVRVGDTDKLVKATGSILDLWPLINGITYPEAMAELRQIAGIGTVKPTPSTETKPVTKSEAAKPAGGSLPEETCGKNPRWCDHSEYCTDPMRRDRHWYDCKKNNERCPFYTTEAEAEERTTADDIFGGPTAEEKRTAKAEENRRAICERAGLPYVPASK